MAALYHTRAFGSIVEAPGLYAAPLICGIPVFDTNGADALVFPEFRQNLGGDGNKRFRVTGFNDGFDLIFVGWIGVGIDETHGN